MMYYIDEDFQRELDQFNISQGGPARIEVCWNPTKHRWTVYAVPQGDSFHPLARNDVTQKLMTNFLDGSGRRGVLLFSWEDAKGDYLALDGRLFDALRLADSFRSRRHYEETVEEPEVKRELAMQKRLRDIAGAASRYWHRLDNIIKSMNPSVGSTGDWRYRYR